MEQNCDSKSRKKCVSVKKYKIARTIITMMCVIMLALMVVPTVTVKAEDEDDSYDLEAVANGLGTIMSIGSVPVEDGDDATVKGVSVLAETEDAPGNAGMVLAYTSKPTSLGQWLASKVSASSMQYDYESLLNVSVYDDTTVHSVYEYAVYGRALNNLGLDSSSTAVENGMNKGLRLVSGLIMLIAYLLASFVDGMFKIALTMLQALNPFSWLDNVTKDYSAKLGAQYDVQYTSTGSTLADNFGIDDILQFIASIYSTMCNLSWALIIPMSIALYLANMFLFRKTAGGKRLLKRIIFIAIGVPLIGGTYTSFLNAMKDTLDSKSDYASNIVASIYVDFENWASQTHLALPNTKASQFAGYNNKGERQEVETGKQYSISVKVPVNLSDNSRNDEITATGKASIGGDLTIKTQYNVKNLCSAINTMVSSYNFVDDSIGGSYKFLNTTTTFTSDETSDDTDTTNASSAVSSLTADDDVSVSKTIKNASDNNTAKRRAWIIDLLFRYMGSDVYTAEQYASSIQSRMSTLSRTGGNVGDFTAAKTIVNMMKSFSRYKNIPPYNKGTFWGTIASVFTDDSNEVDWSSSNIPNLSGDNTSDDNTSVTIGKAAYDDDNNSSSDQRNNGLFGKYSIFNDGGLVSKYKDYTIKFTSNKVSSPYLRTQTGLWRDGNSGLSGLSTMSMYCYLNNGFTSSGVITYGGGNAITNGLTKANHYSVNLVGGGVILPAVYWLQSLILLICIAAIGLLYAIGMFIGTVKYTFKAIGAMPMALLGSMRYIAKFVGMVCAMIINVFITELMYGIVITVLLTISKIVDENPLLLALASSAGIIAVIFLSAIFQVAIIVWLTGIILNLRKSAVNSVTEWITQIVGKFFEADAHADPEKKKAGLGSKVAGGLLAGGAMAKGFEMAKGAAAAIDGGLSNGGDGDSDGDSGDGTPTNDSAGGMIEKESQDHNNGHVGTHSETQGGERKSEQETKEAKQDSEHNNTAEENSESTNRVAQSSSQALLASSNSESSSSKSQNETNNSDESTDSTHTDSATQSDRKAQAEIANNHDGHSEQATDKESQSTSESAIAQQSEQVLDNAAEKDQTGTADVVKQNVDSLKDGVGDLKEAGDSLAHGDVKGAADGVKGTVKDVAGAAAADAVVATTGNTKLASAAGHVTDDAANGNLNKASLAKAAGAMNGANGVSPIAGQKPLPENGTGSKQLSDKAESSAPKKQLSSGSDGNGNGVRTTQHNASAQVGGLTVNSNITNNISNGGTINSTQVQQSNGNGPTINATGSASAGGTVNNTQNITNQNGGGNATSVSGGQHVHNIQNVNNVSNVQQGGGNAVSATGGRNVQNITNVNNAQTVNNVNNQSSETRK